ncbi:MAG: spermidine synthase, partial [Oscillospiraceae bacterium]|nr:spermidine synthase [Oscillospiraceae bacterium]
INAYLGDTIAEVFGNIYTVDVKGSTNRELFASDDPDMLDRFSENITKLTDNGLRSLMEHVEDELTEYHSSGLVLTDDKAPVELLGMRVIDGMISSELDYYKKRFAEDGIAGLIGG